MKRILVTLGVLIALALGGAWTLRGPIALAVMKRQAPKLMAMDRIAALPDGLHVAICGSGGPLPDPERGAPCTAVIVGKRMFLVDAGEGAGRELGRMGLSTGETSILLTHFHSDHIDGLGNMALQRWAGFNRKDQTPLYGPPGVEQVAAGFNAAYALDAGYRTAHHGPDVAPPTGAGLEARPFVIPAGRDSVVVLDEDGLKITAFTVDHGPVKPAVGYRFDYKGRSVVVSGDTAASPVVERMARGADLLVHEALSPELVAILQDGSARAGKPKRAKIFADIPGYHTSPEDAAGIASRAGVKGLVLTHVLPPMPLRGLEVPFLGKSKSIFRGSLWISRDGDLYSLPAGGSDISRKRLPH